MAETSLLSKNVAKSNYTSNPMSTIIWISSATVRPEVVK
ncbi:hypothetical protein DOT_4400 [Desulfosporosinus sp. OT]|nr:hypothetical protein DOT_4400 [Desulfosporosinus sp. OT]